MALFGKDKKTIRFAVVGLGYISQAAVLPAFAKADNCELTALVSSDFEKLKELGDMYDVKNLHSYDQYEECLRSGAIDAVYIALPNSMHCDYTVRAAKAGIHVVCEKPMAVTVEECEQMIAACEQAKVKLLIAYRLHFEEVNLKAIQSIIDGEIGEPRMISAAFGQQVKKGDIRTDAKLGGGALYDMGIYCLNAARYFFRSEPNRVSGMISNPPDERFKGVDALTGAMMEFGDGRIATFVTSLASGEVSSCIVVGDKGSIKLEPAFDYQVTLNSEMMVEGSNKGSESAKSNQFAGELVAFAECILNDTDCSASGYEGLADIRAIRAILESSEKGEVVPLPAFDKLTRPGLSQRQSISPSKAPNMVNAAPPSGN